MATVSLHDARVRLRSIYDSQTEHVMEIVTDFPMQDVSVHWRGNNTCISSVDTPGKEKKEKNDTENLKERKIRN